ncbi:hypothetical protein KUTeg_019797, partial [Tegillarca granosa]
MVINESEKYLIEIKCPYKWRHAMITDTCKDKNFYCYIDSNNKIRLKNKSLLLHTDSRTDWGLIPFDKAFWEALFKKKLV